MALTSTDNLNQGRGNNNAEARAKGLSSSAKRHSSNFYDNPHNVAIAHEASVRL